MGVLEELQTEVNTLKEEVRTLKNTIRILENNYRFDIARAFKEIDNLTKGTDENGIKGNDRAEHEEIHLEDI